MFKRLGIQIDFTEREEFEISDKDMSFYITSLFGNLYRVTSIDTLRDGNTIKIYTSNPGKFFYYRDGVYYSGDGVDVNNAIDETSLKYLKSRVSSYRKHIVSELALADNLLK